MSCVAQRDHRESKTYPPHIHVSRDCSPAKFWLDTVVSPKLDKLIASFVSNMTVIPFDDECATAFGRFASELAQASAAGQVFVSRS